MIFRSTARRANRRVRVARAELEASTVRRAMTHADRITRGYSITLLPALSHWVRQLSPLVLYRALAWGVAFLLVTTGLHAESSFGDLWWVLALGLLHVVVTWAIAPWLPRQSDTVNLLAIAVDMAFCVGLLSFSHDWRGPFWLYAVSAVFWPAYRFTLRGALASVVVFDLLLLVTGLDSIRRTFDAGFGGDYVARQITVFIVAGGVSLTSRALRQVRYLGAESERNRIARELHDGVGKTLGGISMEAGSLALWIDRDPVEASRRARYVARISERAALDVRAVIRSLRAGEAKAPLLANIRQMVHDWSEDRPEVIEFRVSGPNVEAPALIANEVLRMLSELLENIARHAHARHVWLRVTLSSTGVTLAVRDDGVGFDTTSFDPWSGDGHFGLLGARERTSMLGGLFRLVSCPDKGTEVTIDLPLVSEPAGAG